MYQPPQPPLAPQTPQIEARRYTANSHSPESQALLYHAAILQEQARADDPAYGQAYLQLLREAFQEWFDAKIQQALIQVRILTAGCVWLYLRMRCAVVGVVCA